MMIMQWTSLGWMVCAAVLLQHVNRLQAKFAPKTLENLGNNFWYNSIENIMIFAGGLRRRPLSALSEDANRNEINHIDSEHNRTQHSMERLQVTPRYQNENRKRNRKQTNAIENVFTDDALNYDDDHDDDGDDDDDDAIGLIHPHQQHNGGVAAKIDPDSLETKAKTIATKPQKGAATSSSNSIEPSLPTATAAAAAAASRQKATAPNAIYNPFGQLVAFFGSDQLHLQDYNFLFSAERHTVFLLHTALATRAARKATSTTTTTTTTTSERVLNAVSGSIGAVFGVNTGGGGGGGGPTARVEEVQLYNAASLRHSRYNPFNPTRILVHGWFGGSHASVYSSLVPAYLMRGDGAYNIFTVDWGRGAFADYITASYRVKPVGKVLAKFIDFLHHEAGMRYEDVHVIGFSMGAHIAGIAGKYVQSGRLPVIYALDPAQPFFRYDNVEERVAITDADYVEVVHTSTGSYGYDRPLGHVDFYVNYGSGQPGCFFYECSHWRAYQIFAESLLGHDRFRGQGCDADDWAELVRQRRCRSPTGLNMTMGGDPRDVATLRGRGGIYYFATNASPPYARTPPPPVR